MLAALVASAAVDVLVATSGLARRAVSPSFVVALVYAAVLAIGALQRLVRTELDRAVLFAYDVVVATGAIILTVDLLRARWGERVVTDLVVAVGQPGGGGTLRDGVARALGDPSLILEYWIEEQSGYVDDVGAAIESPSPGTGRVVTEVEDAGRRVAVLVHDATTVDDPLLAGSVAIAPPGSPWSTPACGPRLRRGSASWRHLVGASSSRATSSVAAWRELAAGAERRLDDVARRLDDACRAASDEEIGALVELGAELQSARAELREVAQGLRPSALGVGGLSAALPVLVARAPLPVTLLVEVARLAAALEAAVYFVCAEALTDVAKHACARSFPSPSALGPARS